MIDFLFHIEPIQWYILSTVLLSFTFAPRKTINDKLLLLILLDNGIAETLSILLKAHHKSIALLFSITLMIHAALWLALLQRTIPRREIYKVTTIVFLTYAIINLIFIEGTKVFNFNTYIIGSFLYLIIFIYESFLELQKENFNFFLSNRYIVILMPIANLIGFSFVFGFKDSKLAFTTVFGGIGLYEFIAYIVNIIYYSLVNLYVYREKKLRYAE